MQKILDHLFYSILRVDLERGRVHVMHSVDQKNSVGTEREWDEYLNWYKQIVTGDALESLRSDKLLERYRLGEAGNGSLWMTIWKKKLAFLMPWSPFGKVPRIIC